MLYTNKKKNLKKSFLREPLVLSSGAPVPNVCSYKSLAGPKLFELEPKINRCCFINNNKNQI